MKKYLAVLALTVLALAGAAVMPAISMATDHKVTICHKTSSETNPWVRIVISANAAHKHVEHHDDVFLEGDVACPGPSVDVPVETVTETTVTTVIVPTTVTETLPARTVTETVRDTVLVPGPTTTVVATVVGPTETVDREVVREVEKIREVYVPVAVERVVERVVVKKKLVVRFRDKIKVVKVPLTQFKPYKGKCYPVVKGSG